MIEILFEIYEINGFVVCQPALDYCPKKSKKKPLHGKMIVHGWQITGPLIDIKKYLDIIALQKIYNTLEGNFSLNSQL